MAETNTAAGAAADTPASCNLEALEQKIAELEKRLEGKESGSGGQAEAIPQEVLDNEKKMNKTVKIKLFKDNGKYKDDVFVGVNGQSYQIKRGEEVEVPRFVKEVLDNSQKQDEDAAKYAEELSDQYEQSLTNK